MARNFVKEKEEELTDLLTQVDEGSPLMRQIFLDEAKKIIEQVPKLKKDYGEMIEYFKKEYKLN